MTTQLTNNRLFGDVFDPFFEDVLSPVVSNIKASRFLYSEEDESYFVEIESPRFKKEDLSITFNDGVLTVKGELDRDRVKRLIEKHYLVPRDAVTDNFEATLKYGVLKISMPRLKKSKGIEVKIT
jgi:HSP20 family protein